MKLSPEQQAVVDAWGRGLAVMAGAGSGKTTTLVLKCLELVRKRSDAKFAAVSFTERSASDLRQKLSKRFPDGLSGHWVMTIHGLCGAIIREFPRESGYEGGESMLSESETDLFWRQATESLWIDELPPPIDRALMALLLRESRDGVHRLLDRTRELASFGVLERLTEDPDLDPDSQAQSPHEARHDLALLSSFVLERYQALKLRSGSLDFNDLERGALRALEFDEVRRFFRSRFDLVLVDEFQDTNPIQAKIIRAFAREDLSNLCVVGDPKQSIYRFRDADVSLFEEFCAELPERHSLTWNFRSRPQIIEYVNRLCAPAFEESHMVYEPLVPMREADPSGEPVVRLEIKEPEDLARFIQKEAEKGVPLSAMALLMRRIRGNEKWLKALSVSGIPIAVGSGGLFWEDPRIRELVAFLRWWDNPGNTLSGATFLRAPWVGVKDAEIDSWCRESNASGIALWSRFFESEHALARKLSPFRDQAVRPGELLLAILDSERGRGDEGPSFLDQELGAPLLGLWHRAEELSSKGFGFHAVVLEFSLARDELRRERDVPPPRNFENGGQLSVLTLHASKGLEFQHVILIDFGKKQRAPDAPLLFWDRSRGVFLGVRDEEGERDPKHPIESIWRAEEKRKALAESKRLFYVALTRAQERLILVCPELPAPPQTLDSKRSKKEKIPESPFSGDDWRGWIDCGSGLDPSFVTVVSHEQIRSSGLPKSRPSQAALLTSEPPPSGRRGSFLDHPPRYVLSRSRHSVTEWNLLSRCPRSYEWTYVREVEQGIGIPEIGLFTGEKVASQSEREMSQQELGSRVHACLEKSDYDGLKQLEREVGGERLNSSSLISWAMSAPFMAPGRIRSQRETGDIAHHEVRREVWSELPFEFQVRNEVLVGSIDRVVLESDLSVDPRPKVSLIDFKVTSQSKSAGSLLEAYQTQIDLYAYALQKLVRGSPWESADTVFRASLINIAPRGIQAVAVPLPEPEKLEKKFELLSGLAAAIVNGEQGLPTPGALCGVCDHRERCAEGQRFIQR